MVTWLELCGGALLLYLGAEWFVAGASALALALRVSKLLVGLTVVAYGTSAPEIVVGIQAARTGHGDVALGNVIGSNIANVGLILGLTTLVRPPSVDPAIPRRELPVLAGSTLLVPLLLLDGVVTRVEGAVLLGLAVAYTASAIWVSRRPAPDGARAIHEASVTLIGAAPSRVRPWLQTAVGLAGLLLGGELFVRGAVALAVSWGVSERLIGLTVVAVGTSLPELFTSVMAARQGHADLAIGNVVGSNIFNALLCLGAAATVGGVHAPVAAYRFDLIALGVMTAAAAFLLRAARTLRRAEGLALLVLYLGFVALTIHRR